MNQLDAIIQTCLHYNPFSNDLVIPKNRSIYEVIKEIAPDKYSVIFSASRVGYQLNFQPIFTEEGLCFTYNSINSRDMYTDE